MLAILESTGTILLYSGLCVVGKLHIGGVLAEHTVSPFIRRNIPQFNSPFPRYVLMSVKKIMFCVITILDEVVYCQIVEEHLH